MNYNKHGYKIYFHLFLHYNVFIIEKKFIFIVINWNLAKYIFFYLQQYKNLF